MIFKNWACVVEWHEMGVMTDLGLKNIADL